MARNHQDRFSPDEPMIRRTDDRIDPSGSRRLPNCRRRRLRLRRLVRFVRAGLLWLRRLVRLLTTRHLPWWRQDHVHGIAFHARTKFHYPFVANISHQSLQNVSSQVLVGHFASAKAQAGFDLVSLCQKAQYVIPLGNVIVLIYVHTELHFLEHNLLLVLLGRALFLFLLVKIFAVIHDPADRRHSIRGYFYQVKVDFAGFPERFVRWKDSKLVPIRVNYAYFTRADALIHANKTFIYAILLENVPERGKDLKIIACKVDGFYPGWMIKCPASS